MSASKKSLRLFAIGITAAALAAGCSRRVPPVPSDAQEVQPASSVAQAPLVVLPVTPSPTPKKQIGDAPRLPQ